MAKKTEDRTDVEILREIASAKAAYHEAAPTAPEEELRARSEAVKVATQELTDWITAGADPCPECGNPPHGIRQPKYYEIGCLVDRNPDHPEQPLRAIGLSRKNAVDNWNEGEWYVK